MGPSAPAACFWKELGMYSDGCAAAKLDGKWGVLGR